MCSRKLQGCLPSSVLEWWNKVKVVWKHWWRWGTRKRGTHSTRLYQDQRRKMSVQETALLKTRHSIINLFKQKMAPDINSLLHPRCHLTITNHSKWVIQGTNCLGLKEKGFFYQGLWGCLRCWWRSCWKNQQSSLGYCLVEVEWESQTEWVKWTDLQQRFHLLETEK